MIPPGVYLSASAAAFPSPRKLAKDQQAQQDEFACFSVVVFEKPDPNYFLLGK